MNAREAKAATQAAEETKQREARELASAEEEARKREEEFATRTLFPRFMLEEVAPAIARAAQNIKQYAAVSTVSRVVADLVVAKLVEDEYEAHCKRVYVEACREYGSSGEGMHDAYDLYVIHLNWGPKGECPSCDEDFRNQRRSW